MIAVLGVSKKEVQAAALWLSWAAYLGDGPIVVMLVRSITTGEIDFLRAAAGTLPVKFVRMPDEQERGYPGSASHLFVRSLQYCEVHHPGEPILWLETDAIPLERGWLKAIADEYATCPTPFMGHLERTNYHKHMAGVGVYPPDWRRQAPKIIGTLTAPDNMNFGKGKGQGWDTWACKDIYPKATQAKTIQQVWKWNGNLRLIHQATKLFHQCKTGTLIRFLWGRYLPERWTL